MILRDGSCSVNSNTTSVRVHTVIQKNINGTFENVAGTNTNANLTPVTGQTNRWTWATAVTTVGSGQYKVNTTLIGVAVSNPGAGEWTLDLSSIDLTVP